jgi:hypothetical protein
LCFFLSACAQLGDFDRPRSSALTPDKTSLPDGYVAKIQRREAPFPLTEDEKLLRRHAELILAPPLEPQPRYGFFPTSREQLSWTNVPPVFDRTGYATRLMETPYRSATARYSRLIDDIRNETGRIDSFADTARRVIDMDRKREKSIAYLTGVTAPERAKADQRMRGNAAIITQVRRMLVERAAAYRYALEQLVVATPSPLAAEAETALNGLRTRTTVLAPAS